MFFLTTCTCYILYVFLIIADKTIVISPITCLFARESKEKKKKEKEKKSSYNTDIYSVTAQMSTKNTTQNRERA
jgi:hypothetical protein